MKISYKKSFKNRSARLFGAVGYTYNVNLNMGCLKNEYKKICRDDGETNFLIFPTMK